MARSKAPRATPHSRKKSAARDRAAMPEGERWAAELEERLLADAHPFQRAAILDPALRVSFLVGRGGGKTTALRARSLIKMATIPRARIIYAATSRPEAERLNWEPLKQLIDELGARDDFTFNEGKLRCTCKRTGATYELVGIDDKKEVNKYRGQPFNEVQVDEAASHDPVLLEMFLDRAVGPRLGERNGCIVLAGTPGHVLNGRFFETTRKGSELHRPYAQRDLPEFADWIGWSSHAWSMLDVLALRDAARFPALLLNWDAALVEKKRQGWSDNNPIWMREYLGLWASDHTTSMYAYQALDEAGQLFNRWLPYGEQKLEGLPMLKAAIAALPRDRTDWLYGYGFDLGSRDPFALVILAFSPTDPRRRFYHVFSFERRRMYPRTIAELLIGPEAVVKAVRGEVYTELGGVFGLTGWPVAAVVDLAGLGEMIVDELANVYGIKLKPAEKKNKPGAIEVFNGDLVDGKMLVLGGSVLEHQLLTLQWKPDEYGQPKEDKAAQNHSADGATYIRTELGPMFSAAVDAPPPDKKEGDRPAAKGKPAPSRTDDRWGDAPVTSKRGGEFNALLRDGNFKHIG